MIRTNRGTIAVGTAIAGFLALGLVAGRWAADQKAEPLVVRAPATTAEPGLGAGDGEQGIIYGRVIAVDGATWEGRLRFGGDEEAYWGEYFNAARAGNPWIAHMPSAALKEARPGVEIFGMRIPPKDAPDFGRPFMVRFGDISKVEARGRDLRVTLKSGSVIELDRYGADDFADGVRVWDAVHGVVDLDERGIRSIEFLPAPPGLDAPRRLHGTVRSVAAGDFTGFLQWDREEGTVLDALEGRTAGGELLNVPFTTIRSIERRPGDGSVVTLLDGQEVMLSGTREVGPGNRGVYVNDDRYGRVLVPWDAFERVDFSRGGNAPVYDDFPPGGPLSGTVETRSGRRLTGRLVYDLDERDIVETLDAPGRGVDYTIPFVLVASIEIAAGGTSGGGQVGVTLRSGEELRLDRSGDLGDGNLGVLVFPAGRERQMYVRWEEVARIELDGRPEPSQTW